MNFSDTVGVWIASKNSTFDLDFGWNEYCQEFFEWQLRGIHEQSKNLEMWEVTQMKKTKMMGLPSHLGATR